MVDGGCAKGDGAMIATKVLCNVQADIKLLRASWCQSQSLANVTSRENAKAAIAVPLVLTIVQSMPLFKQERHPGVGVGSPPRLARFAVQLGRTGYAQPEYLHISLQYHGGSTVIVANKSSGGPTRCMVSSSNVGERVG